MGPRHPLEGHLPPPALIAWVIRETGTVQQWSAQPNGVNPSRLWRLESAQGTAWLKVHAQPRKHRQEVAGLTGLARALREQGIETPELWAEDAESCALLMSHVPGVSAPVQATRSTEAHDLFRRAGALAARIHALPCDDPDPLPLELAVERRARAWAERKNSPLSDSQRLALLRHFEARHFSGAQRRLCHRDFSTRNWRVLPNGQLGLIDFEHVLPDLFLTDFPRPTVDRHDYPKCEAAFTEGYGWELTPQERDWSWRLQGFHALTSLAWGAEHGDTELCHRARHWLARHPEWN